MTEVEVEANLSFGNFRRGQKLLINVDDPLITVGYFTVKTPEVFDDRIGDASGSDISDSHLDARKKKPTKKVDNGQSESGSEQSAVDGATGRAEDGPADN